MANYRLVKPLLLIAILSLLLTQCTTTVKFTRANDSTQDPTSGFVGVYRYFPSTHPDFTGAADPQNTKGLIYGSVPWRPNPAGSWNGYAVWQPDWYSTPSNLTRIDPDVTFNLGSPVNVQGDGLEFTPQNIKWIAIWAASLGRFTVEWEARINMTQAATLNFTMNSRDDSWFFFDGILQIDLGGGRTVSDGAGTWTSPVLLAGSMHTITIYYAARSGLAGGPTEFYFGAVSSPANAFVYTNPSDLYAKKSFEDSLKHQAVAIENSEDQLESLPPPNRTSQLLESIENLTEVQESNLTIFQGMIENETPQWIINPINKTLVLNDSRLLPAEFISLLESFETLLHTQYDIKESFLDMLNESKSFLGTNFTGLLSSVEELLRSDDDLLSSFENLTLNLFPSTGPPYVPAGAYTLDQQTYFLESYEQLLENQSQLLTKFENLIPDDPSVTPAQISTAVTNGVKWLVAQQSATGSWPGYGGDSIATTGLAVLKLEEYAYELNYTSPFDLSYGYRNNVIAGLNYLFSNLATNTMTLQDHRSGATGTVDNPDVSGDGLGVYANNGWWEGPVYDTGIVLSAISASGTPTRVVSVAGSIVNTWSYMRVAQDIVDWLAWAQSDYPTLSSGQGGWTYWALVNSTGGDNSNSGYATMGLAYAESFGCTIPPWVIKELKAWTTYIQDTSGTTNDGGSWYTVIGSWIEPNILKTGNLILEMALVEALEPGSCPPNSREVLGALGYLERQWAAPSGGETSNLPGWDGNPAAYQTMFTTMKGLEYMGISTLPGGIDWYSDFADRIVAQQDTKLGPDFGSWQSSADEGNGCATIITEWALLTLERVAPSIPSPFKESFEDLLTRQAERIESFENLVGLLPPANRTGELFESIENLTEEQEVLLQSFEGMINATSPSPTEFINLLNSTEDLLDRQCDIEESFLDMLNQSKPYFAGYLELNSSVQGLMNSDVQLLKGFQSLVSNLVSKLETGYADWNPFSGSYWQLDVDHSQLQNKTNALFQPPPILSKGPLKIPITYGPISPVDAGQSQLLSSNVSGGVPPYKYQWYLNGDPVAGATSAAWTFTPTYPDNFTVYLWVACNVSAASTPIYIVMVNPRLAASIIPSNATMIYRGQSQTFTSPIPGGTMPISYQWLSEAPSATSYSPIADATSSSYNFVTSTYTPYGIWSFILQVTDNVSEAVNSTATTVKVTIPADINGDGTVNGLDLGIMASAWLSTPGMPNWNPAADINGDGVVNGLDLGIMAQYWLQSY